jgi:hypothetical protein
MERTIKIFLASSEELKPERLAIAELITHLNYLWAGYGICLRLVKWEYLDSSMGAKHKQEDYNEYLRECDMCVVLYWTKFGMYTEIELETACQLLVSDNRMKQMAVMFKDEDNATPELKEFRKKFESQHTDICFQFLNEAQLKTLFIQQIINRIQLEVEIEHEKLKKNISKLQKILAITDEDDPDYKEYLHDFQSANRELENNEGLISDLERTASNI